MKLMIIILSFFIFKSNVIASAYLTDINIDKYDISPDFNKYNNTYSINIDEHINHLEINYIKETESSNVEIIGNSDLVNNSIITLSVKDQTDKQEYKIIVNKDSKDIPTFKIVEIATDEENNVVLIILVILNLIITIIIYKILFKNKSYKKK